MNYWSKESKLSLVSDLTKNRAFGFITHTQNLLFSGKTTEFRKLFNLMNF